MLKRILAGILVLLSSYVYPVYADMGRILTSDISVSESFQKAIILHNLDEEVLILGTDLVGDQNTTILRFIPFPSEPKVTLAEGDPFKAAFGLIKRHRLKFLSHTKTMGSPGAPADIRFHARLGAHDVTVVKINEIREFREWVREFLKGKGLPLGKGFGKVETVASDYVKRGIEYFVFDLVEVSHETRSVNPLVYGFKSKKLYYPLKTSNTFGGTGGIDLVIIAPGTLCDPKDSSPLYQERKNLYTVYPCLGPLGKKYLLALRVSTSDEISKKEAGSIYSLTEDFFHKSDRIFMQVVRYRGEYDFDDDIFIDISRAPKYAAHLPKLDLGSPLSNLLKDLPK